MTTTSAQVLWQENTQSAGVSFHLSVTIADTLPPLQLTRAACAYTFNDQQQLLLTKHPDPHRSWDIPGGHVETGETAIEALKRELLEETGVAIELIKVIAWLTFEVLSAKPPQYKYPYPLSYTPMFLAKVVQINNFQPHADAIDRGFFNVADIPSLAPKESWLSQQSALHQYALARFIETYDQSR